LGLAAPCEGTIEKHAYDLGALDTSLPFAELKRRSHIDERARAADQEADFSSRIWAMDCPELGRRRQVKIPINQQDKARDEILLSSSPDVLHGAAGLPSCICFAKYFSRLWVRTTPKLRLPFAQQSKRRRGRRWFRCRDAQKENLA